MILRVFRTTIKLGKVDEFRDMLERLSIPMVKTARGMLGYNVGEPLDPTDPSTQSGETEAATGSCPGCVTTEAAYLLSPRPARRGILPQGRTP